jgi:hypothetical protein
MVMSKHRNAPGGRYRDGREPARARRRTEVEVIATKAHTTTPDQVTKRVHELLLLMVLVIVGACLILTIVRS